MWSNSEGEIFHDERDPRHDGLTVRPHLSRRGERERPGRTATTRTAGACLSVSPLLARPAGWRSEEKIYRHHVLALVWARGEPAGPRVGGGVSTQNWPICASNADRNRDGATTSAAWRQSRRAMGKGGIVFYFWGADATEKGSLGPNTVVNSNQITRISGVWTAEREHHGVLVLGGLSLCFLLFCFACFCTALVCLSLSFSLSA